MIERSAAPTKSTWKLSFLQRAIQAVSIAGYDK